MLKATNIEYDVDWEDVEWNCTPEQIKKMFPDEVIIPDYLIDENGEFDDDAICNYISDVTGWCLLGYVLET